MEHPMMDNSLMIIIKVSERIGIKMEAIMKEIGATPSNMDKVSIGREKISSIKENGNSVS
jgi:hypothetical protein